MKVLVDYSWLCYRSHHSNSDRLVDMHGVTCRNGVIYGVYRAISDILSYYGKRVEIYLVLDGFPELNMSLQASYKANRVHDEGKEVISVSWFELAKQLTILEGVKVVYHSRMEADDSIGYMVDSLAGKGERIVILSGDMDLCQLVDDSKDVVVCNREMELGFERVFKESDIFKEYGMYPDGIALYKALAGDSSDNVKGVYRIRRDVVKKIVGSVSSIESFEQYARLVGDEKLRNKLLENMDKIKSNYRIVNIDPIFMPAVVERYEGVTLDWFDKYGAIDVKVGMQRLVDSRK